MLQVFKETGEVDREARIAFCVTDSGHTIEQIFLTAGEAFPVRRFPSQSFVEQAHDPYWIHDKDYIYLNSCFVYDEDVGKWLRQYVGNSSATPIEFVRTTPARLKSLALKLSVTQYEAFRCGAPIWRRSALSIGVERGNKGSRSSVTATLHNALFAWIPLAEMIARHAMQTGREQKGTRFFKMKKGGCSSRAVEIIGRALGYWVDTEKPFVMSASSIGIKEIKLYLASYQYEAAYKDAQKTYFREHFSTPLGLVSKRIRDDIVRFKNSNPELGDELDVEALVEWAARILIRIRLAIAASAELDHNRTNFRDELRSTPNEDGRANTISNYTLAWARGLKGVSDTGEIVSVPIDDILDLQDLALIAFASNIDPFVIGPLLQYRIRSDEDAEKLLPPRLFAAAQWLGQLYCRRCMHLDPDHADLLFAYANPANLPKGLPRTYRDEWIASVKMITSFLSESGLAALMKGASDTLLDGKERTVYCSSPGTVNTTATNGTVLARLKSESPAILAPPIFVEAGWLILPGDYSENWAGKCDPFEVHDFAR